MINNILQIENFALTKMHIEWSGGKGPKEAQGQVTVSYKLEGSKDKKNQYRLWFDFQWRRHKNDPLPGYFIDTSIVGIFSAPEDMDYNDRYQLIAINGGTILYGILRGQIAAFTGAFDGGRFTLPTINMIQIFEEAEKNRAQKSPKKTLPKKSTTRKITPKKSKK